jgi:DASH complex subunit DAD3
MNHDNFLRSTTPSRDTSNTGGNENNPLLNSSGGLVSDLEQEVLDEYTRLLENVNKVYYSQVYQRRMEEKENSNCYLFWWM